MSASTTGRDAKRSEGILESVKVKASAAIKNGCLVTAGDGVGYLLDGTDAASTHFMGVAADTVTGTGTDGGKRCDVYKKGTFTMKASSTPDQTWVGDVMYLVDNQTVGPAAATTNEIPVGICRDVDATNSEVRVEIAGYAK